MVIQYFGLGFIKVSLGDEVLAFSPISNKGDLKGPSFGANICLISSRDKNYNGVDQVTYGTKVPFVVDGPGEYEVNGTFIRGIATTGQNGKINTIYVVIFEDIRLCHLGALDKIELTDEVKEAIGDVDILFVPTYDPASAYKVLGALSPKIVVPLYKGPKTEDLGHFFKECGEDPVKPIERLTLKRKDLEGKDSEIIPVASFL